MNIPVRMQKPRKHSNEPKEFVVYDPSPYITFIGLFWLLIILLTIMIFYILRSRTYFSLSIGDHAVTVSKRRPMNKKPIIEFIRTIHAYYPISQKIIKTKLKGFDFFTRYGRVIVILILIIFIYYSIVIPLVAHFNKLFF